MDPASGMFLFMAGLAFFFLFILILVALRKALKLVFRLIINSVLGLGAIFLLSMVGLDVPINFMTLAVVALFGLGGVGVLLVLMFFGVNLSIT